MDIIPTLIKSIKDNNNQVICDRTGTTLQVEHLGIYSRPGRPNRLVLLKEDQAYPLFSITTDEDGKPHSGILSVGATFDARGISIEDACKKYVDVFDSVITPINLEDYPNGKSA